METTDKLVILLAIAGVLLIIAGIITMMSEMLRDKYCTQMPFDEMKRIKICEVYLNEK